MNLISLIYTNSENNKTKSAKNMSASTIIGNENKLLNIWVYLPVGGTQAKITFQNRVKKCMT